MTSHRRTPSEAARRYQTIVDRALKSMTDDSIDLTDGGSVTSLSPIVTKNDEELEENNPTNND